VAPMSASLSVPHVSSGFPPLATASDQTARSGDQTAPRIEAGSQIASPSCQIALGTEVGGPTVSLGGQIAPHTEAGGATATSASLIARTCTTPSPISPTLVAPRACAHDFGCAPRGALESTHATHGPDIHDSGRATRGSGVPALPVACLHYSRHPRAAWELPAPPLHQQSSPVKAVPMAPSVNPHPMTTRVKRGF
jgi:hypothetical protein